MDPPTKQATKHAVEYLQAQRRIDLVFDALARGAAGASPAEADGRYTRAMLVVVRHCVKPHDFDRYRKRLADLGRSFDMPELFDRVCGELPGWCSWSEASDGNPPWSSRAALRRLVAHGQTPGEKGMRFGELTRAAVRLLPQGSLGRAASALAEAERLVDEAVVAPDVVESVRSSGPEGFQLELIAPFSTPPTDLASLRRFLRFFRALQPIGLLQALAMEERRERRRLILALLEAHGEPARGEALDLLRSDLKPKMDDGEAQMRRNLIYVLRRVPRSGDDGIDEEVAILARHAAPQHPPALVKEAIGALGQIPGRRSEQALQRERQLLQGMLAGTAPAAAAASLEDLRVYLDRTEAALTRRETMGGPARTSSQPASPDTARLSGDSLPGLLQHLAETAASGRLVVEDGARRAAAALSLKEGRVAAARAGPLSGADALYQLLETFEGGSFVWSPHRGAGLAPTGEPDGLELKPLVLEGLRRLDEVELARSIVPDDAVFAPQTAAPRPHPAEKDGLVTRDVWVAAAGSRTPRECEAAIAADAFRIRRLYLHWLEEGALKPAPPAS